MAVSYPGKFRSLAIESGSYATCLSSECTIPTLSPTHPPTLLLHGDLDTTLVPEATVTAYVTALKAAGVAENEIDDANSGHQWIPEAPSAVLAWFQAHP
jgi:predicted esterase